MVNAFIKNVRIHISSHLAFHLRNHPLNYTLKLNKSLYLMEHFKIIILNLTGTSSSKPFKNTVGLYTKKIVYWYNYTDSLFFAVIQSKKMACIYSIRI